MLPLPSKAAGDDGEAEPEEAVADERAGDLGLHDRRVTPAQHEEREDELRRVAEGDIEEATDRTPGASGDVLGRVSHPFRKRHDGENRRCEDQYARHRIDQREEDRDRYEQQQRPPEHRLGVRGWQGARRVRERAAPRTDARQRRASTSHVAR